MSKKTKNTEDSFIADLASKTGGEVLSEVGKSSYFIDTGNLALNYVCSGKFISGGIPGGKLTEVYGPPGGGKSLLGGCCMAACQRMGGIAVFLDCERAANAEFSRKAGHVNPAKLLTYSPTTIEEVESKILNVTKKIREVKGNDIPIFFLWDSISVTPTEREWKETDLTEGYSEADYKRIVGGKERPGERARAAGDALRKLNPFLDKHNATLFIINQIRSNIGVMYGSPEVTAGGGQALPFYCSLRLRVSTTKNFTDKNEQSCGILINFKNKKNRSFKPFLTVDGIQLFYDHGINPLGGLLNTLLMAGRIEAHGKGSYRVLEPWANGKDVSFKSTKEANLVPSDVLKQCPNLIDAETTEQVEEYLSIFAGAIELVEGGTLKSTDVEDVAEKLGID
jgi:recombination protein RecA